MHYVRELLVGQWYRSEVDEHGDLISESANLFANGSYEFCFIVQNALGELQEEIIELGDWGLVGDIHFTIAKGEVVDNIQYAADLHHEDNYHAYQVIQLDSQIFKYQHVVSNEVFIMRRVIDKIGHS